MAGDRRSDDRSEATRRALTSVPVTTDQVAFFPGETKACFRQIGVFDFDTVVFKTLWNSRSPADFRKYVRYYLSDHRPMWMELGL